MSTFNVETILLGINNLRLHKLRSLLTALGIIFGVAAVICMLSVTEGVSQDELRLIQQLGTRNIILTSVKPQSTSQASQANTMLLNYGLTYADMKHIEETVPHLNSVVPLKAVAQEVRFHEKKVDTNVIGVTPDFFHTVSTQVGAGRLLSPIDETSTANVCVIGDEIRRQLFGHVDPLGEAILVERQEGARAYLVVGVLKRVATAGAPRRGVEERDINAEIYIPYSAATTLYGDTTARRTSGMREFFRVELTGLYVTADELEHVIPVSEMVARILQHNHESIDYEIRVPLRSLQLAERKKRNSQYLLGFIAGISLVVGGIGIMNIMLATVTERTREIGIRRALGARQRHITVQFLVETVVLSTTGGLVGVLLGYTGSFLITRWADWGNSRVQPWVVLTSFSLSVLVGIGFGLWPALKAARLDPIEALRHE